MNCDSQEVSSSLASLLMTTDLEILKIDDMRRRLCGNTIVALPL